MQTDDIHQQRIDEQQRAYPQIHDDELDLARLGGWADEPKYRFLWFVEQQRPGRTYDLVETEMLKARGVQAVNRLSAWRVRIHYGELDERSHLINERIEEVTEPTLRQWIVGYLRQAPAVALTEVR